MWKPPTVLSFQSVKGKEEFFRKKEVQIYGKRALSWETERNSEENRIVFLLTGPNSRFSACGGK